MYTYVYTGYKMATKTITIMDDVYELLVRNKSKDESFSDELRRVLIRKRDIMRHAGVLKDITDEEAEEMKKVIETFDENLTKEILERTDPNKKRKDKK